MAGLGMMLAGAFEGLGTGIVEQARQRQAEAQAELDRQTRRDERAQDRQWQVDDQNRQYQREDDLTANTASAYADVFGDSASGGGGADPERATYAAARLVEMGHTPQVAAALVGNMMQESGPGLDTGAVGDNGNAYGAAQWNGPRKQQFLAFAAGTGEFAGREAGDPADIDTQLAFLDWETKNTEAPAYARIAGAATLDEAAKIASDEFWRPRADAANVPQRQSYAASVFSVIANPNTPESVRDDLRRGTGFDGMLGGEAAAATKQFWRDNGDGTETRMGTDSRGNAVEVPGPDGQPLTQRQTRTGSSADATPLSAAVVRDITSRYTDPITDEVDYSIVDPLTAEIERLVGEGMTEQAAKADAISRMEFEQVTTPASNGIFGFGGSPETTEQGKFLGTFREAGAAADAPAETGNPEDQGDTSPKTVDQVRAMTEIDRAKYVESQGGMANLPSDMIDLLIELG